MGLNSLVSFVSLWLCKQPTGSHLVHAGKNTSVSGVKYCLASIFAFSDAGRTLSTVKTGSRLQPRGTRPRWARHSDTDTGGLSTGLDYPIQIPEKDGRLKILKRQMPRPHVRTKIQTHTHTSLKWPFSDYISIL